MAYKTSYEPFGSVNAIAKHHELVRSNKCYSLTFNITTQLNHENQKTIFSKALRSIIKIFKSLNGSFQGGMITLEYNKQNQQHFHAYFMSPIETEFTLLDQIKTEMVIHKKILWTDPDHGYKLKKVDEITDKLLNYPFKDILRTKQIADMAHDHFNPTHVLLYPKFNIMNVRKVIDNHKIKTIKEYIFSKIVNGVLPKYIGLTENEIRLYAGSQYKEIPTTLQEDFEDLNII